MKTSIAVIALVLLPLCALAADPLWSRAVEMHRAHADLVPGSMVVRFDQYNGRGDLISASETILSVEVGEDGEIRTRVIAATSDGDDVTAEQRQSGRRGSMFGGTPSPDGDGDENAFSSLQRSPFDPDEQENVSVTRMPGLDTVDGNRAQSFAFEHRIDERTVNRGTAWLDPATGEPIQLQLTMEPLPRFVSELVMIQRYGRDSDDRWVLDRIEFTGEGRVLFFRRRVKSEFLFSDYFRAP